MKEIIDFGVRLDKKMKRLRTAAINKKSRKAILDSVPLWKSRGLSPCRIIRILDFLMIYARFYGGDITHPREKRLISAIGDLEGSRYTPETKESLKSSVKEFYRYCGSPRQLDLIHKYVRSHRIPSGLTPSDLISHKEFNMIINNVYDVQERAFYEVLRFTGFRFGEARSIKKRDIRLSVVETGGSSRNVTLVSCTESKTRVRTVPVLEIMPALMRVCEDTDEDDNYIFPQQANSDYNRRLKRTVKQAGIRRRIWFHLFRHTRYSELCDRGVPESALKWYFGWCEDTRQASRYRHLTTGQMEMQFLLPQLTHSDEFGLHSKVV